MSSSTFREYVETVRSTADIVEIVSETVPLKKSGHALVGLCPFHQEKTPSFRVDGDKGVYYCFGCQAGGDLFHFVQNLHRLEFVEAVHWLAERYSIPRPAPSNSRDAGESQRRTRALEALQQAQAFFESQMHTQAGKPCREYLQRRGIDEVTTKRFGLGWAPDGWELLLRHLSGKNFSVDDLIVAGLVVPRREGSGVYDRFRRRVTFPIRDTAGRIVSFGGRTLGDDDPKYLNGPETSVYDKGKTLYRLSEVASEIRKSGRSVIVEGYFDALGLAAAGVPGAVAVCGTSLGPAHAKLLRRYADRTVLVLDADAAGRRAARRALGPLLSEGLSVRIAVPPAGQDPDDIAREQGAAAVEALVEGAVDVPTFLVDEAREQFDLKQTEGRVAALEMVLGHLVLMDSVVARTDAIAKVADGLGIEDRLVVDELRAAARNRERKLRPRAVQQAQPPSAKLKPTEVGLIRFLIEHPGPEVQAMLDAVPEEVLSAPARSILDRLRASQACGQHPTMAQLAEQLPQGQRESFIALAFAPGPIPDPHEAEGCVVSLKEAHLRKRLHDVQRQIEGEPKPEELNRLYLEKAQLAKQIHAMEGAAPQRDTRSAQPN